MASILFRIAVCLNFVRFGLSFWPGFEGTSERAGIADHVFNPNHYFGFRLDFVWLLTSTFVISLATVVFMRGIQKDRGARVNAMLGLAWLIAFAVYVAKLLSTGILDFG